MNSLFYRLVDAWRERETLGDGAKQRSLAQFLPAALELQESPPNPIARRLAQVLIAIFVVVLLWACFGKVDVVASAEGKIIPSGRVKQIQPRDKGIVKAIHVKEGQYVTAGEALVELDQTLTSADQSRMQQELRNSVLNLAAAEALEALMALANSNAPSSKVPKKYAEINLTLSDPMDDAYFPYIELYQRQVWEQWRQYLAQVAGLQSAYQKAVSEKSANQEVISKLTQVLPIISKRAEAVYSLYQNKMASESEYLELEQQRIEYTQELATQTQVQRQLGSAAEEAQQAINAFRSDAKSKLLTQIADYRSKIGLLRQELVKAKDLNNKQILFSPVSGYVQQLAINTVGGVVTEAQQLMLIVPEDEALEVQVMLSNQDIGFVREGMPAEIKVHTFPFTKYGLIDATVKHVSEDAVVDEKLGLIYPVHLIMNKNSLRVDGRDIKLMSGMAVTAEVKTDKRRVIEFFLSPLMKYGQESIRER